MARLDLLLVDAYDAKGATASADARSLQVLDQVPAREARFVASVLRKAAWRATRTADRLEARAEDVEAAR